MKRRFLLGATIAMALVAGGNALAQSPRTEEMLAMISNIEFITQNSSLEYAGQALPGLTIVTDGELQLLFRAAASHNLSSEKESARVAALYDRYAGKILLTDVKAIEGPALFHELVHFLQDINGKVDLFPARSACLEAEAYDLQAIWQEENAIDIASKPDYGFVMTLYGVCNDADFSWVDSKKPETDVLFLAR